MRARRGLLGAAYTSAAGCLLLAALSWWEPSMVARGWPLCLALSVLAALLAACWRVDVAQVARRLDRSHGLPDTVQSALQYDGCAPDAAGFITLLLREAEATAVRISVARALPLRAAAPVSLALAALALCVGSSFGARQRPALRPVGSAEHSKPSARVVPASAEQPRPEQPVARYRRLARELAEGALSRDQAISALLEVEQALRGQTRGESLDASLSEQLSTLFGAPSPDRRSLARLSREQSELASPEQRSKDARFIEEKRRELEQLRQQHARDAAAQRALSELSKRLSRAQQALDKNQPDTARSELEQARQQVEQHKQQSSQRAEASRAQQQAEQLRELLQRRAGAAARETAEQAQRRAENERQFSAQAGGQKGAPAASVRQGQGESGGAGEDPPESDAEPDLFSRDQRPRVALEDHAAPSVSGEGDSRSEVILRAADHGFASTPYRRVYSDYRYHAEELLLRDDVPAAYRFYVRRYFQLIKPRAGRVGGAARQGVGAGSSPPAGNMGGDE